MTGDCGIQIVAICLETRGLLVVGFQEMQPHVDLLVDLDSDGWVELTASGEELFDVSHIPARKILSFCLPILTSL